MGGGLEVVEVAGAVVEGVGVVLMFFLLMMSVIVSSERSQGGMLRSPLSCWAGWERSEQV